VLASGSFHLSGNFWAPLAVVVAVLVPVIIWRFGTPRRLLLYSLVSDTALLTSHARARTAGAELQIILGGQELRLSTRTSSRCGSRAAAVPTCGLKTSRRAARSCSSWPRRS